MQGDAPWRALEWREWCGTAGHDPLRDGLLVVRCQVPTGAIPEFEGRAENICSQEFFSV
jgi:hypothetical protein